MTQTKSAVEFKQATLGNGLTVIAEVNPEARSVALGYFCKTGSRDESPEVAGVSHFLEHMLFKGSATRDALGVNLEFDQMGAQYNAYTSEENTVYYGAVLPEFAPRLLELWTDLMRPALRQEDFDTEKQVILEEIALYEDRPNVMLFDWGRAQYFAGHPLGHSVLGTTRSITALTRAQMADYLARRYVPGNLVLTLAGRVDWERTLEQVAQLTAGWPKGEAPRAYPEVKARVGELREPYPKATQTYLAVLAPGVSAQDPRRYAASILANILGEEGNSRLHWALTDRGLVESVGAGVDEADRAGLFYIYAQTHPVNEEAVKGVIREELGRLEREGVRPEELERAKNKLATALVFAGETPMQRLMSMGLGYIYNQTYEPLSEIARKVEAVTTADVNALLEEKPFSRAFYYSLVPA
ncbi:MAG: pitrilysin family protein [Meiothermus sp.]|uniref:M16 family metallopeptidase n=1 Tax=Meiothermus sp. TaxID=1955249 RepID=UPI0025FFC59E|nr:pitrilysin family protein [Meiothermus sp.]MCS7068095.1 insulinase family protein [Meiothermus sp.]MDW8425726.1 pitrilysin family protein [Meiothermus sp.]